MWLRGRRAVGVANAKGFSGRGFADRFTVAALVVVAKDGWLGKRRSKAASEVYLDGAGVSYGGIAEYDLCGQDRINHIKTTGAQTGNVFLASQTGEVKTEPPHFPFLPIQNPPSPLQ